MKTLFRVFAYVRSYPWMAAGTLLCAVLSTLMVTVFPKVTQLLIDEVRAGRRENLMLYSGIALTAFFLRDLLNGLRIILNNTFEQKVIF
ncbi:MAG: transporter-related protein, partial [Chthoniobacteraceae bacterium]|nr:transporter-related protein [Chthoniobacteraceae bacterium]